MEIKIINEQSIALYFKEEISESNYRDVESVTKHIHAKRIDGIKDVIPSYRAIMISFDNKKLNFNQLIDILDLKLFQIKRSYIFQYYIIQKSDLIYHM